MAEKQAVQFHYIKSNHFRVVHADGVWGGPTPRGLINMSFFSERLPIPKSLTHEVTDEGIGPEIDRKTKEGIIREIEVEVVVDSQMAQRLVQWLQEIIDAVSDREEPE